MEIYTKIKIDMTFGWLMSYMRCGLIWNAWNNFKVEIESRGILVDSIQRFYTTREKANVFTVTMDLAMAQVIEFLWIFYAQ